MAVKRIKANKAQLGHIGANPFRGGCNTVHERSLIPSGGYSMIQNMRNKHPGLIQRGGCREFNTTGDGTNKVLSLHQFSKGKMTERHFFAQMSDGDILEATNNPPTTNTTFGSEVFSGSSDQIPASWAEVDDILIMSNGADQHKAYAGTTTYIRKFIKYDSSAAPPEIPENGYDYTYQVTDGDATTVAVLDNLDTYANHECIFICTPIPANRLTWTILKPNGTVAVGTLSYRKNDNTWADTTETDGTINDGKTLAVTESMIWTHPSDEIPCYMFGESGFWYRWETDTQLDAEVEISSVTFGSGFQSAINLWDGIAPYAIETRFYVDADGVYYTYSGSSIEIDGMTTSNKVYFNSADPIVGFYINPGQNPNTTASTTVNTVYGFTGAGWISCGTITDESNGCANPGWITFPRLTTVQPSQFQGAEYFSYWYYFTVDKTLSDDVIIDILTMPYFDVGEIGKIGNTSCAWGDRVSYSFNKYPQYIYISAKDSPLVLNGEDFGIMEAGDGRTNKIVCQKRFYNELMVWQKEQGVDGGCLTLFEGYSPPTYGKLVLSTKIGTFNAKSAVVVDGVLTSTATDETIKTLAFFLSHVGICASDGTTITVISDDIQNYFDPKKSECIRYGYEDDMWIEHDPTDNVLRIGLVSGSSATVPNIFPVFDLVDKTWSFDTPAQELSCIVNVDAASGNIQILQYGGGIDDGKVYQLNYGTDDVSTAIDAYATIEINYLQYWLQLRRLILTVKSQSAGNVTITPYRNGVSGTGFDLSMIAGLSGEEFKRHLIGTDIQNSQISLKFQNAIASQELYLLKLGLELWVKKGH